MMNNSKINPGGRGWTARLKTEGPFRSDRGLIFGVASGLAEHYGWPVFLTRLALVLAALFLFFWPVVIAYLAAALIMSPAPPLPLSTPENREVWLRTQMDPEGAVELLSRRAARLERRLGRMEDYVTSKDYTWRKKMSEHP